MDVSLASAAGIAIAAAVACLSGGMPGMSSKEEILRQADTKSITQHGQSTTVKQPQDLALKRIFKAMVDIAYNSDECGSGHCHLYQVGLHQMRFMMHAMYEVAQYILIHDQVAGYTWNSAIPGMAGGRLLGWGSAGCCVEPAEAPASHGAACIGRLGVRLAGISCCGPCTLCISSISTSSSPCPCDPAKHA